MKLYLAHPFDSRHRMRKWEKNIEMFSRMYFDETIEIINPFFDVQRPDQELIEDKKAQLASKDTRVKRYAVTDKQMKELVERDLEFIKSCDGVIAIIDGSLSYGTIQEMVYAKNMGKKVYAMISNGQSKHPWLRYHADVIVDNMSSLSDVLYNLIREDDKE